MKNAIALSLAVLAGTGWWVGAAPAWGAPAPGLSEVRVYKVESAACTEQIPERANSTRSCLHRGPVKVYVMEVGLGNNAQAYFDGARVQGASTAICQVGSISQACNGAGTVMGYIYVFSLDVKAQGSLRYSNTSINVPHNTLATTLTIQ